jgi:hypothetical protein
MTFMKLLGDQINNVKIVYDDNRGLIKCKVSSGLQIGGAEAEMHPQWSIIRAVSPLTLHLPTPLRRQSGSS